MRGRLFSSACRGGERGWSYSGRVGGGGEAVAAAGGGGRGRRRRAGAGLITQRARRNVMWRRTTNAGALSFIWANGVVVFP